MSEKEKKIIETIAEALPNMSERDKGYFLGYAEAKADKTPADRESAWILQRISSFSA